MTHSVQLVIGNADSVAAFLRDWPCSRAVELAGRWQAVPVDDALFQQIEGTSPGAKRPEELDSSPPGLEAALATATLGGRALAYVETDYWGGSGGQSAVTYVDGRVAVHPYRSKGAGGPINSALRSIGVVRGADDDEFDTIGLGERRTMADYEPEGPVRLRGMRAEPEAAVPPSSSPVQGLPVWLALALVAGFIAIGVAASMLR